jgi:hypothetical protein
MITVKRIVSVGLALCLFCSLATAQARRIIVHVDTAPLAWSDSRVQDEILTELSRDGALSVVDVDLLGEDRPPLPQNGYDAEAWLDWGTEVGGRYLLVVDIEREVLERQKTFSIPIICQRWETIALIEGELKLFDLQKRRLMASEPFTKKLTGARQFQGSTDDNRSDPSLHLTASEKSRLFQSLESELARKLTRRVGQLTRGR